MHSTPEPIDITKRPRAVVAATELLQVMQSVSDIQIGAMAELLDSAGNVYLAGGGRSGLIARAVAMRLMHIGLSAYVVGETNTPGIRDGDVFWAFSSRGTGVGLNSQAFAAQEIGAKVGACVADATSELANRADHLIQVPAGFGGVTSVQHAGSLFEQSCLLVGDAVAAVLQALRKVTDEEMSQRHFNLY